jgi:agmatine deiminase
VRWPAEWEPHRATWLAWPHAPTTWPGHLAEAQTEYTGIVRALQGHEAVELLVRDAAMEESARKQLQRGGVDLERGVRFHHVPTNDSWLRDTGPIFVEDDAGLRRALAFRFNAWGGKYPPWDLDDAVGSAVAALAGVACEGLAFVLEGGSIDGDGAGTILTTESCLLNPNREARTRTQMEERLARWLGARRVVWLGEGIAADDTDGHIDDCARFVAPGVVVAARADSGPDQEVLAENRRRLVAAGLAVHDLPMPPVHRVGGEACPASYANFYLANGAALVPTFGAASDARALDVLRDVLPGREVIGVPCRTLVLGLGAIHCLSQQEPA